MTDNVNIAEALADLDMETVVNEQALQALDAIDAIEELDTTNVAPAEDASLEADEEFLKDLDISVAKAAAYGAQEVTPMPDIAETVEDAAATAAGAKPRKVRATTTKVAKNASAPRATKELSAVPAEFFDLFTDSGLDAAAQEGNKTAVIAKRPGQVKIAEKFDNLFTQLAAGRTPSVYVMQAFKLLDEKKTVSSADLIANYRAAGLGDGTARSQTGQIMVLFDAVGIAGRTGKNIALLSNSKIAERIRALSAAPATAA